MIDELRNISAELLAGRSVPPTTVRAFLSWFDAQRRGYYIVERIDKELAEAGVKTNPDYQSAWIDAPMAFELKNPSTIAPGQTSASSASSAADGNPPPVQGNSDSADSTDRISRLQAANQSVLSVKPDDPLAVVVTMMMMNSASHIPIMTGERSVKGIITWRSIAEKLFAGKSDGIALDFGEDHFEVRSDSSIFDAIPIVILRGCVLVRAPDNRVSGIVTASDLSLQFRLLTEPFLLLNEIEILLRRMISKAFTTLELRAALSTGGDREITSASDLAFGDYLKLLQQPNHWIKLNLRVDRNVFCYKLDSVRKIRNDVMHFDPDGITETDVSHLRDFKDFLERIN